MRIVEDRGSLVGAVVVSEGDEVLAITAGGGVIRTPINSDALRLTSRDTMGVRLMNLGEGDTVVAVASNVEHVDDDGNGDDAAAEALAELTDEGANEAGTPDTPGDLEPPAPPAGEGETE